MEKDLISVIIPTYNRSHFLNDRIKELKEQTYQNWEVIFINDASNDNTIDIIKSYDDPRIKLINLDINSHNVSIPRNIGISAANGEFICHCDDDDIHVPNKLKTLHSTLTESGPEYVLSYGNRIARYDGRDDLSAIPDWNPKTYWGVGNGQYLYRSSVYNTIPLIFCKRACDWELCKFIIDCGKFKYVNENMVIVMWHGGNRSLDNVKCWQEINIDYYKDLYNKNYDKRYIG
jgi:glycosyltransferase involved in cell wall biosynthesis